MISIKLYSAVLLKINYLNCRHNVTSILVYLNIHVLGTNSQVLTFLVDTGSQRSFISRKQYEEKLKCHTPYKDTIVRIYGIGGAEMYIKGQTEVPVHVGKEMLYHNFLIAEIEEEAIVGFDFMKEHKVEWTWADQPYRSVNRDYLVTWIPSADPGE